MHPVKPKLKNRKKKYDWSKSTHSGDACCAAADSTCPDDKPDGRFWQYSETVSCDSRYRKPAKRGTPIGSAATTASRLQVAQASRRENALTAMFVNVTAANPKTTNGSGGNCSSEE